MKTKILMALGAAIGFAIYEMVEHGIKQADWRRVVAVPMIMFVLLLFVPNRWFEIKKTPNS
ncbi:hypothetical protein M2103_002433 [Ereboglobus sp. PH5-5]|uniref:hypothetical protein n=1 Tax=unclassified Ereboglobus TaxID=2626932 RepID=UPI0024072DBC|nr:MULTISPECIES: hypothetical protein [unclassified Ereboglobus]MDF9828328.1 hypothetical protein [Ereboglobus sp. PH5-10]MDF9834191.1 hypothetical protein [Ereboglobus sp. PH5-5]